MFNELMDKQKINNYELIDKKMKEISRMYDNENNANLRK